MKHSQARAHKVDRQREALLRNEAWAKLSTTEKLAALDKRLGKGVGAKRQRAKLAS
jgi:hypothetical protein